MSATDLRVIRATGTSVVTSGVHNSLSGRSVSGSHPAEAIAVTPSGNLAAGEVGAALNELQSDIDTRALWDGGAASNTARLTIPKNDTATLTGLTRKEATIIYDTTEKKLKLDDGSVLKAVGGGLVPVPIDKDYATALESGKHYLLNAVNAGADITLNLVAGASEADIKVTVINNPSGRKVIIDANGSEKIFYDDTDCDTVTFEYAETEQWIELCWNGTKWIVNDSTGVISGTFNGALTFTGPITPLGGIVGITGAAATTVTTAGSGSIGEKLVATVGAVTLTVSSSTYNAASLSLTVGIWVVYGKIQVGMSGTTKDYQVASLSLTTATEDDLYYYNLYVAANQTNTTMALPRHTVVASGTQTIYLTARCGFTGTAPATDAARTYLYAVRIA